MFKKRSKITKKASSSRGSKSSGRVSNVSSFQMIGIERITSSDEDSNDSYLIVPVRNPTRRFIIDDSSDEENTRPELSIEWDWKETDNTPTIWKYSASCGVKDYVLNQLGTNHGLLDLFFVVFDENLWNMFVTQTNLYTHQIINDEKRRKVDDAWFPVTHDEMMAYYALCILMVQVKTPNVQMYWSKREIIQTSIFGKVMPFKRFSQIYTNCSNYRLQKIRPIITYWNEKFNNIYTLDKNISIDESLMRYKGCLIYRHFNPSKQASFELKMYKLCEANTGFCSKFKIYTGEVTDNQHKKTLKPNCVVEYDKRMGGIDLNDQMLACFPITRKFLKGYKKLFFYMSDMALFNTYIMKKQLHNQGKQSYVNYRIDIAEVILKHVQLPDYTRPGKSAESTTPLRLQAQYWTHFAKHIDGTPKKKHPTRTCKVCYKQKKQSETTWECTTCKVALHLPECFIKYHTMQDY